MRITEPLIQGRCDRNAVCIPPVYGTLQLSAWLKITDGACFPVTANKSFRSYVAKVLQLVHSPTRKTYRFQAVLAVKLKMVEAMLPNGLLAAGEA